MLLNPTGASAGSSGRRVVPLIATYVLGVGIFLNAMSVLGAAYVPVNEMVWAVVWLLMKWNSCTKREGRV